MFNINAKLSALWCIACVSKSDFMTDKQLKKLMDKTLILAIKHRETLRLLEAEYFKRFGHNPSEVDDDFFIDTFHYGNGGKVTIEELTDSATLHA